MEASYRLDEVKQLFTLGHFYITSKALETAQLLSFLDEDIVDCITCHLSESHFYKTMPAEKVPGLMQDVYKIRYEGARVYLKLQINRAGYAVVVSFKEDESFG